MMGLHSGKNFVTANAIEAILAKPKQMPQDFRCGRGLTTLGLAFAMAACACKLSLAVHCCVCFILDHATKCLLPASRLPQSNLCRCPICPLFTKEEQQLNMRQDLYCRWTLKPEFGEVPQYLIKNKKQIADEKARVEEHIRLRQQQVSH